MSVRRLFLAFVLVLTLLVPLFAATTALGVGPGTRQWVKRYVVTAGDDWWSHAAKGPGGTLYVAGQSDGSAAILVAKYYTDRAHDVPLWTASSDPTWSRATVAGIAVDAAGNCYVAGTYETETDADSHIFLARFSAAGPGAGGSPQWQKEYNGPGSGDDAAGDLALDRAGGVYVGGSRSSAGGGSNAVVVKYRASDGFRLWDAAYGPKRLPPYDSDWANAVIAARNGTCYFAGQSQESADVRRGFIVKIKPDGTRDWAERLRPKVASTNDTVNALAFAPAGGAIVAGSAKTATRGYDVLVARYGPGGKDPTWARVIDAGGNESGLALRLDEYGRVLVAGDSVSSDVRRGLLLKLGLAKGALKWKRLYRPAGSSDNQFSSLAIDGAGNAYCGGYSDGLPATVKYLAVVKYSPAGVKLWSDRYRGPASGARGRAVVYVGGTRRALYAAGGSNGVGTGEDAVLIKYTP